MIIIHSYHRPADDAANSVGGEAACHAASKLVRRGQVDLEGAENVTKMIEFQMLTTTLYS